MWINAGQMAEDRRYFSNQPSTGQLEWRGNYRERESYYMTTERWEQLGSPGKIVVSIQPAGDVDYDVEEAKLDLVVIRPDGFSDAWDNTPLAYNPNN